MSDLKVDGIIASTGSNTNLTLEGKGTGGVKITDYLVQTKGSDVSSATALTLGKDGNFFDVTGTTTITSIGTQGIGSHVTLQFDGVLTFTHHSTDLILPGAANITTAAGDIAVMYEYASGDWRCVSYSKASGAAVVATVNNDQWSGTDLSVANGGTGASTHTANNVLLGNGTSAFQVIAPGSDGQVLTSTGSTWQSETAAAAGLVFISSATISSDATINFTGIDSTYDTYLFDLSAVRCATDSVYLQMLFSTDGGSSYLTSSYAYGLFRMNEGGYGQDYSSSDSSIHLTADDVLVGNATAEHLNGWIRLHDPSSSGRKTTINAEMNTLGTSAEVTWSNCGGMHDTAQDTDAVRFKFSSGNLASGTIRMYGVSKS
jgi:hypothetical protein